MFKELAGFTSLLRQAQQLGGRVQQATEELKERRVTGSAGAGMVEVTANGTGEILRVKIDPELVARGDREMIEDLLTPAINQALTKAKELYASEMQSLAQEMEIPGLSDAVAKLSGQFFDTTPET